MGSKPLWSTDGRAGVVAAAACVAGLAAELTGVLSGDASGDSGSDNPDPLTGFANDCLDGLAAVARVEAAAAAAKIALVAAYAETAAALEAPAATPQEATARDVSLAAEVACVLAISEPAANLLLSDAHALTTTLPLTLDALASGTVSWQHARILVDETTGLNPAGAAALEAHFLDPDAPEPARGCPAGNLPPSRFRTKARTWRERHHPASIEKRHAKGLTDRRVEYTPDRDGMAWLSAYLPATTATGIWNRLTTTARTLQGPDETRTLTQLRPDILAGWLLATRPGEPPSVKAQVLVTVPVFSLLGATDEPAMLDGYGPIPASMARDLVTNGADSFYRVLTDPRDGAPLDIGRTSYRITAAIRRALTLRDGKCTFPGCNNHTPDNDTDHLHPWHRAEPPASPTSDNSAPNTTDSNTTPPGPPPQPPKTNHPTGPHPPAATTKANTPTGNHPTGPNTAMLRRLPSWNVMPQDVLPRNRHGFNNSLLSRALPQVTAPCPLSSRRKKHRRKRHRRKKHCRKNIRPKSHPARTSWTPPTFPPTTASGKTSTHGQPPCPTTHTRTTTGNWP